MRKRAKMDKTNGVRRRDISRDLNTIAYSAEDPRIILEYRACCHFSLSCVQSPTHAMS